MKVEWNLKKKNLAARQVKLGFWNSLEIIKVDKKRNFLDKEEWGLFRVPK